MLIGNRPLAGWVIVLLGARNLLGRPAMTKLSPVYEMRTIVDPRVGIVRQVVPLLFYPIADLEFRGAADAPRIAVDDLPLREAETLEKAVKECDKALEELLAAQTGIVVAQQTPKPLVMP
jgi:hypothetical protein